MKNYNQMNEVEMDFFSSERAKMKEFQSYFEERMFILNGKQAEIDKTLEGLRNGF